MKISNLGLVVLFYLFLAASVHAGTSIRGILVYAPYPGGKNVTELFSGITWQSGAVGVITRMDGTSLSVGNSSVVRLIYLDEPYWKTLSDDDAQRIYRTDIRAVEIALPLNRPNMTTTEDLNDVVDGLKKVDGLIAEYPELQEVLTAVKANLNRQVDWFQQGQRKVDAKWLTAEQYAASLKAAAPPPPKNVLDTLDGKHYENYQVTTADPASLHIIYDGGVATIPFAKLPSDIQKQYNYDPEKAAEFIQSEKARLAALNAPKPGNSYQVQDQSRVAEFLSQQTGDAADSYRKLFSQLDAQKVTLMVMNSQVVQNGMLVTKYYPVPPSKLDFDTDQPIFIAGQFNATYDTTTFNIELYPAGTINIDATQSDSPKLRQFVSNKMDYIKVMQINYSTKDAAIPSKDTAASSTPAGAAKTAPMQ